MRQSFQVRSLSRIPSIQTDARIKLKDDLISPGLLGKFQGSEPESQYQPFMKEKEHSDLRLSDKIYKKPLDAELKRKIRKPSATAFTPLDQSTNLQFAPKKGPQMKKTPPLDRDPTMGRERDKPLHNRNRLPEMQGMKVEDRSIEDLLQKHRLKSFIPNFIRRLSSLGKRKSVSKDKNVELLRKSSMIKVLTSPPKTPPKLSELSVNLVIPPDIPAKISKPSVQFVDSSKTSPKVSVEPRASELPVRLTLPVIQPDKDERSQRSTVSKTTTETSISSKRPSPVEEIESKPAIVKRAISDPAFPTNIRHVRNYLKMQLRRGTHPLVIIPPSINPSRTSKRVSLHDSIDAGAFFAY